MRGWQELTFATWLEYRPMRYKLLEDISGRRKFVLALNAGESAVETITAFAQEHRLGATSLTGIGAFAQASLGYFNPATKEFRQNEINDQTEVLSMIGNIAVVDDGTHKMHVHVVGAIVYNCDIA